MLPLLGGGLASVLEAGNSGGESENSNYRASGDRFRYPARDYSEQSGGTPGGTLKVSVASDTGNLDLHSISHTNAEWLGRILYDNLVYLDEQGEISPWLAKSWTVSPDGKTYTFHLLDDVTFSDGSKFNAKAVLVNLEHMRDPATKSPLAAAYIDPYVDGKVVDEYTVQLNLREAYTPFLNVLAQSWLAMESPKAIREKPKELGEAPVGSGPFVVESYTRQQGIKFVRRKDYNWSPAIIKHSGPAYLNRIEIQFVPEATVRYASLTSGQFDFTIDAPPQSIAAMRSDQTLVVDRRIRQGNPFRGIIFNTSKPPFDEVTVRRAVAAAIDREGIAQLAGFGELEPKADFLAANTRFYDPAFQNVLRYDVAEANRLLDQAGWTQKDGAGFRSKGGERLSAEMLVLQTVSTSAVPAAIQSDLKKIGFELKLVQIPLAQYADRRAANNYQAIGGGVWHTNTPDGLYIVYDSNEITSNRRIGQNISRLQDSVLDDLLQRARQSNDPKDLADLYSKVQKRLTEVVPAVPLYDNYSIVGYKSYVKGIIFDTSHNTPIFTTAWLSQGKRL
ncbi:MAG TPA: ABC transporter substrate-binding protein [Chthoniobacterales bacterium]